MKSSPVPLSKGSTVKASPAKTKVSSIKAGSGNATESKKPAHDSDTTDSSSDSEDESSSVAKVRCYENCYPVFLSIRSGASRCKIGNHWNSLDIMICILQCISAKANVFCQHTRYAISIRGFFNEATCLMLTEWSTLSWTSKRMQSVDCCALMGNVWRLKKGFFLGHQHLVCT